MNECDGFQTEKFSKKPAGGSWKDPEEEEEQKLHKLLHNGYATEEEKSSAKSLPGARIRKRVSQGTGYTTHGVEIRGRPLVQDCYFLGKDDHVLTDALLVLQTT
jgi:hypothetical protein